MRLFLALPLPDPERERLAALRATLPGARWVRPDLLHVTLRFFGETRPETAEALAAVVERLDLPVAPVAYDGLLTFPDRGAPRVLAVRVRPDPALTRLHAEAEALAARFGFGPPDHATFRPHVTLARFRNGDRAAITDYADRQALAGGFVAERLILFHSTHEAGRLVYLPLAESRLTA